jgi:hypothetical protein
MSRPDHGRRRDVGNGDAQYFLVDHPAVRWKHHVGSRPTLTLTALADTPSASPLTLLKMAFVVVATRQPDRRKARYVSLHSIASGNEKRYAVVGQRAALIFLSLSFLRNIKLRFRQSEKRHSAAD